MPTILVSASTREATFTASPMAVYSMRRGEPMLPTTARPVWMPMPMARGVSPPAPSRSLMAQSRSTISRPAATAASA